MKFSVFSIALGATAVSAMPFHQTYAPVGTRQVDIPPVDVSAILDELPVVIAALKCSNSTASIAARNPQLDIPAILEQLPDVLDTFCAEKRSHIAARASQLDIGSVLGSLPEVYDALQGHNTTVPILPRKPRPQLDVNAVLETLPRVIDSLEGPVPPITTLPFPLPVNGTVVTPDTPTILSNLPAAARAFQRRHQPMW